MSFEYEVYLLDDRYQLCHKDEAILATNNLAVACSYCYEDYEKFKRGICVWQPRTNSYREYYATWLEEETEMSKLPKNVTMTKEGGRYHRAVAFSIVVRFSLLPFATLALLLAFINPFWFRESFFSYVERKVHIISAWISYKQYTIYLGCDPEVWHTLKD